MAASNLPEKWDRLKGLLRSDPEFQARFPEAFELLFDREAVAGLHLPTFGGRVLENEPSLWARSSERLMGVKGYDGGFADAYSFARAGVFGHTGEDPRWPHPLKVPGPLDGEAEGEIEVLGRFPPMYRQAWNSQYAVMDIRGLLLALLSRDDLSHHGLGDGLLKDKSRVDAPTVRISDLRLAWHLFAEREKIPAPRRRQILRPVVNSLPELLTPDSTMDWKRRTLKTLSEGSSEYENDDLINRVVAVAFVAAAVCLFLDLGGPNLDRRKTLTLTDKIASVADEVVKLKTRLDTAAEELATTVADRTEGRPPRSEFDTLFALSCYRMGYDENLIAERVGIKPWSESEHRGTKSWRKKLRNVLARGVEIEKKHYAQATAIFDRRKDDEVSAAAARAYRAFGRASVVNPLAMAGKELGVDPLTDRGAEVVAAYVQLGSCQFHGIEPCPKDDG